MENDLLDPGIKECISKKMDFDKFYLVKYDLFMDKAKSLSLVIDTNIKMFDPPSFFDKSERNQIIKENKKCIFLNHTLLNSKTL